MKIRRFLIFSQHAPVSRCNVSLSVNTHKAPKMTSTSGLLYSTGETRPVLLLRGHGSNAQDRHRDIV